jgi:lambda repressor-like predicted transcriptional regulator
VAPRGNQNREWDRFDIIAAVRKSGTTLAGVGRAVGLSRKSMSWALIRPHTRANLAIAEAIGQPPHVLWPQWFDASGERIASKPLHRSRRREPLTTRVRESNPTASPPSKSAA